MSTFKKIMTRLTVLFVLSSTFYSLPVFATEGQTDAEVAATTDLREETRDVIPEAEVNTENEQPPLEEVESEAEETEKESADLQKVVQQSESENKTDQQAAFYATVKEIDPEDYQQGRILNLREESDSKKVTANWHLVTDGRREYPLLVQFNNYNNSFKTTKITVDIPRGVMVAKADLEAIKNNPDSPVTDYEIHQTPGQQEVINTYATNLKETVEINPNSQSNKYLYGVTLTFHLDLGTSLLVTKGVILPLRTIYDDRFKNFWSGVTGSSLTRNLPINVNLIEDEEFKKTLILDDILIEAEASFQNITRDPANSASNVPGVQVLKETNEVIVQPRLRNNTENPGSNSYYMGNPAFDVYVPYKAGSSGKYISATVDTQAMDDWLSELKKLNNGKDIMKYTIRATDDGRNIVKYEFVDDTQEFMLLVVDLSLFYIFPEEKFDYGDTVLFPRDSIGWYLKNYQYNEHGERQLVESARKAIGDSATKVQLVDPGSFDFSLSSTSSYKPIFTDTQKSTSLLGYVQLANHSDYEGQARASFEFDVHNTWNYGVTTVKYWAVDQSYGNEKNSIVPSQNYTYSFNYVLQKRGSVGEENQIQGVHQLTPADAYKDDIITRADGYKHKLLNYANKVGDTHPQRFFYYVNREMLVSELSAEQLPVDFDISDYFIKKLSYEFDVKGGYMSGNSGRIKEGGGQFYGYQFGSSGKSMDSKWSIEGLTGSNRDTQVRDFKTTSQKKTSNGSDTALFLNSTSTPMKITDENGKVLTVDSPRIKEGEKINISASALACFYPYGNTSYAPDPVFLIRAPREFTLKENTIQIKQGGQPLSFTMEEAKTLTDGSLLFIVKPEGSSGLGYYSESRDLAGDYLDISYQMELNFLASGSTFAYRELLFITDKNYGTNMTSSYAEYLINDSWGIAEAAAGSATFHKPDTTTYRLPTTKVNSQFSTAASKLNFGLDTTISKDDLDPINDNMGILDKESRIFETTFSMKNLYQNGYVDKQGKFIAYIPIAKQDLLPEWTKDESDYPHQFSLALTGPVKLTSIKGVSYEVGYTTDDSYLFNNGRGDFLTADGYATYKKYDEINADLAKVTMVKIVAKATDSSNVIVPFGEEMSATLPLKFQSGSAKSFYENTGQKTSWQPYLVQNYTMNGVTNEFHNAAPKRSTRIRYRPERQKIDLFAYNEEDHPNSNDSKTGQVKLPGFINQYNLDLQPLNPSSFYSLNLNSLDQIRENKKSSVSYGNSTFAFTTDLNRITTFDLIQAYEGKALSLGGLTGNDDFLNYQVYNADNINDTLGERQVTLKYRSTNSDDIEFEVVLNVIRKASKIQAENALIAGKVYKEFTNAEDNIRTTLQDGSFTTQFEMNTQALQDFQVAEGDKENYYLLLSEGIKLPQNATILMKLQSKDGTQKSLSPEYYFYRNKSATAQSKISLFDFQKMGTNDTMLTADDVKRHVDESESLSYLFVFDFEQGALASVSDKERVQMSYPLTTGGEEDTQATPEVKVNASRMTSHNIFGLNKKKYEPGEVLTLSGGFNAMSVGKAVDSFNQYKYFVLDLQLVEVIDGEEKPCNWPAGSSAQNTVVESNPILYPRMGVDSSHLVVPVSRVDPNDHDPSSGGTSIPIITPYSLDIRTDVSKFGQGKNYRIKINSVKNLSTYYPLGGEKINSMLLGSTDFKVVKPEASGLNVKTEMKDRVIYNQSATQTVNFDLVMDNIEKIVPTIEIQRGTIFEERPWQEFTDDPQPVINTEDLTAKKWSLTFKENLPATLNDEYHIIFKAYRKGESQPAYEVPWSFVVWDPIKK